MKSYPQLYQTAILYHYLLCVNPIKNYTQIRKPRWKLCFFCDSKLERYFPRQRLNNKKLRFFFWSELSLIESAQNGSAESLPSPKALLPQFSFLSSQSNHHISILRGALLFQNGMILLFTILKPSLASS